MSSKVEINGQIVDIPDAIIRAYIEGDFSGKKIILVDPDDPTGRTRIHYEDLDQEVPSAVREALVTIYPDHAQGMAEGDTTRGLVVVSHKKAVEDMVRMIEKFGYRVKSIQRDL